MRLTDNEKRDVIKYLEAGKPLPEKYRFLLFDDDREVELLWNGKTNEVTNVVLPFQVIEQIDEPRSDAKFGMQESLFDTTGRQITGWTNKLIWGDNKLILSSLKNGPLRKEIEAQGGLKLIYIDPPFDVGADFSMDIEIGEESFTKKPSVIEEIAYRDTWGRGADSFISMIYERLQLMRDLLAEDGSIYVHCDWRVNSYMRLVLDEVFGVNNFLNQIVWSYEGTQSPSPKKLAQKYDSIFRYSKDIEKISPNKLYFEHEIDESYSTLKKDEKGFFRIQGFGDYSEESIRKFEAEGRVYHTSKGTKYLKHYVENRDGRLFKQKKLSDVWTDITQLGTAIQKEKLDYPTQKPEKLLIRIIETDTKENDLIADFFCGSGTTLAVAEQLGRKWIGADLGKFGIHTSRKRLIGVQRELKKAGKDFRAFEILNVGKYERDNYLTVNKDLRAEEMAKQAERKEKEFIRLIISAYKAEELSGFVNITGKKRDRFIIVGPISTPVSSKLIQDAVKECKDNSLTKVDVLGFDYEMGMNFQEYKDQGIDIAFRIIPREVFDKKAVDKGQVKFYDVAYIDAQPLIKGRVNSKELSIELVDFSVFYNQDATEETAEALRPGGVKVVVENGQVVKISKDKVSEIISKEILTKKWSDWIDYWAVDYNFASRKEIIAEIDKNGKVSERWTGDYIFDNEWQSFRTKKNRNLELFSAPKEMTKGTYKVAIKVVDIFGNDTTRVLEVTI